MGRKIKINLEKPWHSRALLKRVLPLLCLVGMLTGRKDDVINLKVLSTQVIKKRQALQVL